MAWSLFGRLNIVFKGDGGRVKIWDINQGRLLADLKGHTSRVASVDWSKDGTTVGSVSADGTVLLWKVNAINSDLSEVAALDNPFQYTTGFSSALSFRYSPRNTCVVVGLK